MRYSTKVQIRKTIFFLIAIIAFIALNIFIFTMVISGNTPIEKSAVLIASNINDDVFVYDQGALAISGTELTCYDINGISVYTYTLPSQDMKAYRKGNNTICWQTGQNNLVVFIDNFGKEIVSKQVDGQEIILAVCNDEQFAVAILEDEQTWIKVYNENGALIEENIQPFLSILSLGYFGEDNAQLWTLMLDYHGTLPITKLYTSYPGSSQTGRITINNQICYDIIPMNDFIYLIGTHHIQPRTYTNTKISEWLINGWTLQDYHINNAQEAAFLLAPSDTSGLDVPLSAVWYINPSTNEQYRISMPSGVKKAVLTEKKIYAISSEGIYDMNKNGQKRDFVKLPFKIDEVIGISYGKAITIRSENNFYMIKLK